ncbi:TonB-dependent receptor domain-containing protein [Chryseobacterium sp.]|uniref:TonB-dependent receptor domain-containing protein n=1 Tax=Chryseobacterium sp. TaxID=1871047 RepID=UPI00388E8193
MKKTILISALFFTGLALAQEKKVDSTKTKNIDEVTLTKKVFKKETDRFVYDVASSPVAKGNTTFELLKQTPLLSTTDDKTLMIAGKSNAVIFINGRKSTMDAESLAQFLKSTPADNIQKIEVITVPGSEFQVESSEGVINIILKKKMTDGLNGSMRLSNIQNKYNASSSSFSANYRKDKLGISANLSGGENTEAQSYILKNGNQTIMNESVGNVDDPNKNLGGYLNIDYQLTDKSNIALSWNTWANKSNNSTVDLNNTSTKYDDANNLLNTAYSQSKNSDNSRSYNNSFNLNYELKTDSLGSKLNINAAYLNYRKFQTADNNTIASNSNWDNLGTTYQILQSTPQQINNYSAMADYIQKFKNDYTVAIGGNYNNTNTDNDTQYFSNDFINPIASKPNYFVYKEHIYGLYLNVEKKFSNRFSGKIGARYEMTNSLGTSDHAQDESLKRIERKYNNFLPFLNLNFAINENHNLSYAFSSRMRRPSFWELNPVKNILTRDNYVQNNPFVKASANYNQELTYMYKSSYFLILSHNYAKDKITQVPLQREIERDGVKYQQLAYIRNNFGNKQEFSAMLGMQKSFFKQYLTSNFNIGVQHNRNNGSLNTDPTTGDIFDIYENHKNSTSFVIQTNNTVRLDKAKTWFAGVNFFFVNKQQIELGQLQALSSLDLSIKKIWNSWTFSANFSDILKKNVVTIEDRQVDGNYNYVKNDTYNRGATISISYSFGNQKVQKMRNIDTADKDIKNRTK